MTDTIPLAVLEKEYIPKTKRKEEDKTYSKLNLKTSEVSQQNGLKIKNDVLSQKFPTKGGLLDNPEEESELDSQFESLTLLGNDNFDSNDYEKKLPPLKTSARFSNRLSALEGKIQSVTLVIKFFRCLLIFYYAFTVPFFLLDFLGLSFKGFLFSVFDQPLFSNTFCSIVIYGSMAGTLLLSYRKTIVKFTAVINEIPEVSANEHDPFLAAENEIRSSYHRVSIIYALIIFGIVMHEKGKENYIFTMLMKIFIPVIFLFTEYKLVLKIMKWKHEYCAHVFKVMQVYDEEFGKETTERNGRGENENHRPNLNQDAQETAGMLHK